MSDVYRQCDAASGLEKSQTVTSARLATAHLRALERPVNEQHEGAGNYEEGGARREEGQDDDLLQYALEWGFFTRCQAGEFDTALCELERCWGKRPESPMPIGTSSRPAPTRTINSLDDVHAAVDDYVSNISTVPVLSTATHLSTDINYCEISESEMTDALSRRDRASIEERNIYASYVNERFLSALERLGDTLVFQFSMGAEPLPFETSSRLSQQTIGQLGAMVSRHPGLRFQCLLASRHANQSLCSLCRELPNLSLAGYWWHNFFPSVIGQVMEERLDMLPTNKQGGFFSDDFLKVGSAKSTIKTLSPSPSPPEALKDEQGSWAGNIWGGRS